MKHLSAIDVLLYSSRTGLEWGGERRVGEKRELLSDALTTGLYSTDLYPEVHTLCCLISRLETSASRIKQGMGRRAIRVPETHTLGMVWRSMIGTGLNEATLV